MEPPFCIFSGSIGWVTVGGQIKVFCVAQSRRITIGGGRLRQVRRMVAQARRLFR
jgi:16S rRNA U516 pseudouridylate synthase RsuA-like enzyme